MKSKLSAKELIKILMNTPIFPWETCPECRGFGYVGFAEICPGCQGIGMIKMESFDNRFKGEN